MRHMLIQIRGAVLSVMVLKDPLQRDKVIYALLQVRTANSALIKRKSHSDIFGVSRPVLAPLVLVQLFGLLSLHTEAPQEEAVALL